MDPTPVPDPGSSCLNYERKRLSTEKKFNKMVKYKKKAIKEGHMKGKRQ